MRFRFSKQAGIRVALASATALVLVLMVMIVSAPTPPAPQTLNAAPVELAVPQLDPSQLGQWCVDRKAQGTAGLSSRARNWLTDCIAIFGAGLTPSGSPSATPSATLTASPSASPTVQPSPTISPTATTPPATTPPATTPPPSPTGGNGCLTRLAECGYPNAGNTGVPAGTALTVVQGDLNITTSGTVVDGMDVRGCIVVNANAGVEIRNSRVNCPFNSAIRGRGIALVQDTEVICGPNGFTGISAALVIRRVHIHGCENGLDAIDGTLVEDSYIHDMNGCCDNHTDGMQIDQVGGVVIRHNTVIGGPLPAGNAAITLWDSTGAQTHDLLITNNLLAGGGYTLRCGREGEAVNVAISGNRFGPAGFGYAWGCNAGGEVWTGNVDDATGSALAAA